jgi:hypothetical protein
LNIENRFFNKVLLICQCPSGRFKAQKYWKHCEARNDEEGRMDNNFIDLKVPFKSLTCINSYNSYLSPLKLKALK